MIKGCLSVLALLCVVSIVIYGLIQVFQESLIVGIVVLLIITLLIGIAISE